MLFEGGKKVGLITDFLGGMASAIGEAGRMARTEKQEKARMTPELQRIVDNLIKRAEAGDVEAMADLGCAYFRGTELRYDPHEACKWWTMAAEAGHVGSMYNLGILYTGDISKQFYNDKLASYWLEKASIRGDKDAQEVLNEKYTYSSFFKKWKRR